MHIVCPSVIPVTQCGSLNQLLLKLLTIPEEFRAEPAASSTSEDKTSQNWCVLGNIFSQGHSRSPNPSRNLPCFPLTSLLCIHSDPFVTNGALMCVYMYNVMLYRKLSKPNRSVVQILNSTIDANVLYLI